MKIFLQPKTTNTQCNDQGFTLIEVMIALLVFTVGIMAVATMSFNAFNNFSQATFSTEEVNRAVTNIDTITSMSTLNETVFPESDSDWSTDTYPPEDSIDREFVTFWQFDNVVVRGVKFIAVENNRIKGGWTRGDPENENDSYRLFNAMSLRTKVN